MSSYRIEKYLPANRRIRMLVLMAVDVSVICMASFLGLFIRFDLNMERIPAEYIRAVWMYLPLYVLATIVIFFLFRMYATMWSVAGIRETGHIVAACGLASLLQIAGMLMMELKVPRSYYVLSFFILCAFEGMVRLSYRILTSVRLPGKHQKEGSRILIAGAGTSGSVILKEMLTSPYAQGHVVCFVDDDKNKVGKNFNWDSGCREKGGHPAIGREV